MSKESEMEEERNYQKGSNTYTNKLFYLGINVA